MAGWKDQVVLTSVRSLNCVVMSSRFPGQVNLPVRVLFLVWIAFQVLLVLILITSVLGALGLGSVPGVDNLPGLVSLDVE